MGDLPTDSRGNEYNPDAGNTEPVDGKCNFPLTNWEDRYGEKRYCSQWPNGYDAEYCNTHIDVATSFKMRAQELYQHGVFANSVDHVYTNLDGYQRALAWASYDVLLDDSKYEFGVEYDEREIDFEDESAVPNVPEEARVDATTIEVEVPRPHEQGDRAAHLWVAAVLTVQEMDVQSIIAAEAMEKEATQYAEFDTATVVGENGGGTPKSWQTIDGAEEHHLNLPFSRMVKDRKELLKYGGVEVDGETNDDATANVLSDFVTPEKVQGGLAEDATSEAIADTDTDLDELVVEEDE